jgi:hypothetical protein
MYIFKDKKGHIHVVRNPRAAYELGKCFIACESRYFCRFHQVSRVEIRAARFRPIFGIE